MAPATTGLAHERAGAAAFWVEVENAILSLMVLKVKGKHKRRAKGAQQNCGCRADSGLVELDVLASGAAQALSATQHLQ